MKVAVGSTNPVKITAVRLAFEQVFPDEPWDVSGVNVRSNVRDQPLSDKESIKGAKTRAKHALRAQKADFGVGLEGGLHRIGKLWFDKGWIAVIGKDGKTGIAATVHAQTPPKMIEMVLAGKELGHVDDILFHKKNSKHAEGHFGLMTKGHITRTDAYADAVVMALASFLHPDLYDAE